MIAGGGEGAGAGATEPRVAVVVIAAADDARLTSVLESVRWTTARVVVDLGGANEATLAACDRYGARSVGFEVLPREIARLEVDWVLLLEGHEIVPSALAEEILATLTHTDLHGGQGAYRIGRRVGFLGATLRYRVWEAEDRVRLARPAEITWQESNLVSLAVHCQAGILKARLVAEPYASLRHYVVRMDIMTRAMARLQNGRRRPARVVDLVVPPLFYVVSAIAGAAARDGFRGVLLVFLEAYALVVTCAKRWELDQISGSSTPAS